MKRKTWFAAAAFLLISIMMFSLCACDKAPQTSETDKVTQENVAEVFMPSLEAYVYYTGSNFYTVEKNEDGSLKSHFVLRNKDENIEILSYKVVEYNEFAPVKEQMLKYMSEDVFQDLMGDCEYVESEGSLYIVSPQRGTPYVYDITSIRLLDSDGDKYTIAVDLGSRADSIGDITEMYKTVFTTELKDGILVIEFVDRGESYTPDEMEEFSAEGRKWIGELYKIYGTEPEEIPFS